MSFSRAAILSFTAILAVGVSGSPVLAQQMPCANEIMPLRQQIDKDGAAVKALIERKAERSEVCNGLKRFAVTEAKFVKYLEANASWCGVPPEALQQVKAGHAHTLKMRGQACAAGPAAGRAGPPPGPGLSDALGTARTPMASGGKNDRGTYNSLTGNPLQR